MTRGRRNGYILVETMVALGVLSVGMIVIQQGLRQAIISRGQAMDFTTARFILEEALAWCELQPRMQESSGNFQTQNPRFQCTWELTKVEVPKPQLPLDIPEEQRVMLEKMFNGYMGKLKATVKWSRAGMDFEVTGQTLLPPEQIWSPPVGLP